MASLREKRIKILQDMKSKSFFIISYIFFSSSNGLIKYSYLRNVCWFVSNLRLICNVSYTCNNACLCLKCFVRSQEVFHTFRPAGGAKCLLTAVWTSEERLLLAIPVNLMEQLHSRTQSQEYLILVLPLSPQKYPLWACVTASL